MSENQTYEIAEYSGVAAAMASIEAKYAGRVYDVLTREGMADAKAARREIREARTGLERLRKEIKAPAWKRCQLIDSEAKEITKRLSAIEDPIDAIIKAEEQRAANEKAEAERKEALRVATIRERIEAFNVMPPWGSNSEQISARLREVNDIPVDDTFAEFTEAAAIAKAQAITRLSTLAEEARMLEAEQAKLKALADEQMAKIAAERKENEERLARERAEHEARMAEEREARRKAEAEAERARNEERARMAEEARIAREAQARAEQEAEAERVRLSREAQEARLEQAAAWDAKKKAEEDAAREKALSDAKCETYLEALKNIANIVALWLSDQIEAEEAMDKIEVIVAANN